MRLRGRKNTTHQSIWQQNKKHWTNALWELMWERITRRCGTESAPREASNGNLHLVLYFLSLYACRRHREKLQAHFSDGRSLRDCSINAPGPPSKPSSRLQYSLLFPKVRPPDNRYPSASSSRVNLMASILYGRGCAHCSRAEALTGWCTTSHVLLTCWFSCWVQAEWQCDTCGVE